MKAMTLRSVGSAILALLSPRIVSWYSWRSASTCSLRSFYQDLLALGQRLFQHHQHDVVAGRGRCLCCAAAVGSRTSATGALKRATCREPSGECSGSAWAVMVVPFSPFPMV